MSENSKSTWVAVAAGIVPAATAALIVGEKSVDALTRYGLSKPASLLVFAGLVALAMAISVAVVVLVSKSNRRKEKRNALASATLTKIEAETYDLGKGTERAVKFGIVLGRGATRLESVFGPEVATDFLNLGKEVTADNLPQRVKAVRLFISKRKEKLLPDSPRDDWKP